MKYAVKIAVLQLFNFQIMKRTLENNMAGHKKRGWVFLAAMPGEVLELIMIIVVR